MKPVADYLSGLVSVPVKFAEEAAGPIAKSAADSLKLGEILVLENTRFFRAKRKMTLNWQNNSLSWRIYLLWMPLAVRTARILQRKVLLISCLRLPAS